MLTGRTAKLVMNPTASAIATAKSAALLDICLPDIAVA